MFSTRRKCIAGIIPSNFRTTRKFRYGCNFGVGVSFWDILFGTFCMPKDEKGK